MSTANFLKSETDRDSYFHNKFKKRIESKFGRHAQLEIITVNRKIAWKNRNFRKKQNKICRKVEINLHTPIMEKTNGIYRKKKENVDRSQSMDRINEH